MNKLAMLGGSPVRQKNTKDRKYPVYDEAEEKALLRVLHTKNWGGFPSPNTEATKFAADFASFQDAKYGICAANGTVTLEIALRAAGIHAGDEVIVPPLTFMATAQAVVTLNAIPVFADIDPETYCIDPKQIEKAITEKTKAIIPVHLGCRIADLDAILEIARKHNLIVIEDCAHAHGGKWKGKGVGSYGHLGSFSMQSSKLLTAGEGGAILTSDEQLMQKCQSLVNCGRKEAGYKDWEGHLQGWNYRITEWQAAILQEQLKKLPELNRQRTANIKVVYDFLERFEGIKPLFKDNRITDEANYQLILRFQPEIWDSITKDQFIVALQNEGFICSGDFYTPLYGNKLFQPQARDYPLLKERYGDGINARSVHCPVVERVAKEEQIWLPHDHFLGDSSDAEGLIKAIEKIWDNRKELAQWKKG